MESRNKAHILIADDSEILRRRIANCLELEGYTFEEASNGLQVLEAAQKSHPDMFLLDWIMPEANGIEVCRRLRQLPAFALVPVIILTVKGSHEEVSEAFLAGVNDYIRKPFSAEELLLRIRVHLTWKSHIDTLQNQLENLRSNPSSSPDTAVYPPSHREI